MILLDGPLGTALSTRGVATPPPLWSARALETHPSAVADLHRAYAQAGATVHTACTFRTTPAAAGAGWRALAERAVSIARESVPEGHRVAGSVAPIADCYRPDLSPSEPGPHHRQVATALAGAGVDLLLCETFPHVGEALAAVEACVATGVETWVSFTPGPWGGLLTPEQAARGAEQAVARGASAVLVNCAPPKGTLAFVQALAGCGVPVGAYANAGGRPHGAGWTDAVPPREYAALAASWVRAGASIVGSCCGTGPAHTRALRDHLGGPS